MYQSYEEFLALSRDLPLTEKGKQIEVCMLYENVPYTNSRLEERSQASFWGLMQTILLRLWCCRQLTGDNIIISANAALTISSVSDTIISVAV